MASMLRRVQGSKCGRFGRVYKVPVSSSTADRAEEVGASKCEAKPEQDPSILSSEKVVAIGCPVIGVQNCAVQEEESNVPIATASDGNTDGSTPNEESVAFTAGGAPHALENSQSDEGDNEEEKTAPTQSADGDFVISKDGVGDLDGEDDTIENLPVQVRFLMNDNIEKTQVSRINSV